MRIQRISENTLLRGAIARTTDAVAGAAVRRVYSHDRAKIVVGAHLESSSPGGHEESAGASSRWRLATLVLLLVQPLGRAQQQRQRGLLQEALHRGDSTTSLSEPEDHLVQVGEQQAGKEAREEESEEDLAQPSTLHICPRTVRFTHSKDSPKLCFSAANDTALLLPESDRSLSIDCQFRDIIHLIIVYIFIIAQDQDLLSSLCQRRN